MSISPWFSTLRIEGVVRGDRRSVIATRAAAAVMLSVIFAFAACRDASADTASCPQYPILWRPTDGGQSAAQSELAAMSPGATMSWNGNTGTLTSVSRLGVPLDSCSDGQDANAQVMGLLAAHPALFQIDLAEWQSLEPYDCKYVDDATLALPRQRLAGWPVARDMVGYWLRRVNGVVQLTAVNGVYLPVLDSAAANSMSACNTLTEAAATTRARSTQLTAGVYSQCNRTGTATYTPRSNDTIGFVSDPTWTWQEGSGQVELTGQRTLRVIVNPANYNSELLSSDARCPAAEPGQFTVGFDVVFDVHTGAIVSVKPGIDCVVC
jgi:hypothetical protein